jgi:hypothetical protein
MRRLQVTVVLFAALSSMGAVHRTQNFVVHAATAEVAQQVGQLAEHYRKDKAQLWLGAEMPPWPQPCPLHVSVTMSPPSGATTFTFGHDRNGQGQVMGMRMEINGPLDRLLASVLPHEITHTVFAHYFRCPVPRWADEGGSVLSEDKPERDRHDRLTRQFLNEGKQIPMRTLFSLKEYPANVHALYAEGFSITEFLVKRGDRGTFLRFLAHGMNHGWDGAVQTFYGHSRVEELESAWLTYLRDGRITDVARGNTRPASPGTIVRLTVPPGQAYEPAAAAPIARGPAPALPIARGAMPSSDQLGQRFGDVQPMQPMQPQVMVIPNQGNWQPVQPTAPAYGSVPVSFAPVPVTLGVPVYDSRMPVNAPVYTGPASVPVSYPR